MYRSGSVAVFMHDFRGGGAERAAVLLVNGLIDKGADVHVIVLSSQGPVKKLLSEKAVLVELKASRMLSCILELSSLFKSNDFNFIVSHMTHANVAAIIACKLAGCSSKLLVVEHSQIERSVNEVKSNMVKLCYRLTPLFYKLPFRVVTVSEGVAHSIQNYTRVNPEKIECIYNPVSTGDGKVLSKDGEEKSNLHPFFNGEDFVFLGVGSLRKAKGFHLFIEAISLLAAEYKVKAIILGEGPERKNLEEKISTLNVEELIDMPGYVDNVPEFMSRADVFVLSSLWEGLPTVLIEALACGVQVVATNCKSGPSEILLDGEYGFLAEVESVDSLVENMKKALFEKIPQQALIIRANDFSTDKSVDNYIHLASQM